MKKILRGMTWDHERGYDPLVAVTKIFSEKNPEVEIEWQRRSLKDFGDYPLEKLIPDYDMVMIDHPFTGEALVENLLVPLNSLIDSEHLVLQEHESLGPCYKSYLQDGQMMALPVDAAALVSAARGIRKEDIPCSWDNLLTFSQVLGKESIAVPLCEVDMWCLYLTLNAQCCTVGSDFFTADGILFDNSIEALEKLYELISYIHSSSFKMNPIMLFNAMAGGKDGIVYTPFAFGYTNYSRAGYRKELLEFFDAPTTGHYSTILGGVGIGISTQSKYPKEATDFIQLLTAPDIQKGIFTKAGGQPAHRGAWLADDNNYLCNNFFRNTYKTLEQAYTRPRVPRFNQFQEQASVLLHRAIQEKKQAKTITKQINELYNKITGGYHGS